MKGRVVILSMVKEPRNITGNAGDRINGGDCIYPNDSPGTLLELIHVQSQCFPDNSLYPVPLNRIT